MKHQVIVQWERNEIPPRCRKPRPIGYTTQCEGDIEEVASVDAPVAISNTFRYQDGSKPRDQVDEYRWWNQQLWAPTEDRPGDRLPYWATCDVDSDQAAQKLAQQQCSGFLLIDDQWWSIAQEPVWETATFGLGCNHGGSALMLDERGRHTDSDDSLSWFRLDEPELATRHALAIATKRGDDQSLSRIRTATHGVEVLIPEAIRATPHSQRVTAMEDRAQNLAHKLAASITRAASIGDRLEATHTDWRATEQALDELHYWRQTWQRMEKITL